MENHVDSSAKRCNRNSHFEKICLLGGLKDKILISICKLLNLKVVFSTDGKEFLDIYSTTIFVSESFENDAFHTLYERKATILGPTALKQLLMEKRDLNSLKRPIYSWSMDGVVLCFTGFRDSTKLKRLAFLARSLGASVRPDMSKNVTHLIANVSYGEKYKYAFIFGLPIMQADWILAAWELRDNIIFSARFSCFLNMYKQKTFFDCKVNFCNFSDHDKECMERLLLANGGTVGTLNDNCTHMVVNHLTASIEDEFENLKLFIVKADWFWLCLEKEYRLDEAKFSYYDFNKLTNLPLKEEEILPMTTDSVMSPSQYSLVVPEKMILPISDAVSVTSTSNYSVRIPEVTSRKKKKKRQSFCFFLKF